MKMVNTATRIIYEKYRSANASMMVNQFYSTHKPNGFARFINNSGDSHRQNCRNKRGRDINSRINKRK